MLHRGEEAGAPNIYFFRVKWLQPTMKGTSGAATVVLCANCSSCVFCNEWLCLCAEFHTVLQSLVADYIGMAASLS